ncbi:MAG: glycosyltransferase family 4 protein [Bacteroidia bacterium]|nr:glycosyltransferase family 4 protein [Bacteroidia bacterium]
MAEHMGLIYKDEKFRQQMITKGKEKAGIFSVEKAAEKLWDYMENAVK